MGVKIKEIIEGAKITPGLARFAGKTIVIDAFNVLYSFISAIRYGDAQLVDHEGRVTSHLSGFFFRCVYLMENRIKPVFVFDGKAPELKADTIAKRIEVREAAGKKAEEARERGDVEDAIKYAQASSRIEPYMIPDAKQLLDLMGVAWIDAPAEAEAQAASMVNQGTVEAIASQDYDCLLFGARRYMRNLTQQKEHRIHGKVYPIELEYYTLDGVLQVLGVSREQLVDLGILMGTDFNQGIRGIGPKTALKLVTKHGSIEDVYAEKPEYAEQLPLDLVKDVRDVFLRPDVSEETVVKHGVLQEGPLLDFLCKEHDFNPGRIQTRLAELKREQSKKRQQSLDSFF